jgi:uncharacterized membrane protein YedE/YeeE
MDAPLISTAAIAWMGFALGAVFGFIGNKTSFCTMGAISDAVNMGDWTRIRMWVLAIAVALFGVAALQAGGLLDVRKSLYLGSNLNWLSHLVGGALFGVGMVLASGCGSKTLIRIGGGNLKSLLVFIVMGIAAFATMRGLFGVWRVATVDAVTVKLATPQDLPSMLAAATGLDGRMLALALPVAIGVALLAYVFAAREARSSDVLLGGIGIGLTAVGGWYVTGHVGFVAEHPETLQEAFIGTIGNRPESLSLVAPAAYALDLLMFWSDKSKFLSFGVASALGIVAGSAAWAVLSKSYREEVFPNGADFKRHLVGAILMGIGGVTALGCTIGQGLTGVSTLSLGSILTLAAIFAGAAATMKYEYWRLMRE